MKYNVFLNAFYNLVYPSSVSATNIAFGKPTMQSTTRFSYNSDLAVDGNFITWSPDGYECTHTYTLPTNDLSWWVVDLGSQYVVTNVVIYGRDDPCCCKYKPLGGYALGLQYRK